MVNKLEHDKNHGVRSFIVEFYMQFAAYGDHGEQLTTFAYRRNLSSEFDAQPRLLENRIRRIAGHHGHRHRKAVLRDWALPDFVATLALSHEHATVFQQDAAQLGVIAATQGSHRNAVIVGGLCEIELQAQGIRVNHQTVRFDHVGRKFPDTRRQGLESFGLGHQMQRITFGSVHAVTLSNVNLAGMPFMQFDNIVHNLDSRTIHAPDYNAIARISGRY